MPINGAHSSNSIKKICRSEGENLNETETTTEAEATGTEEMTMKSNEAYETFHPKHEGVEIYEQLAF